MKFFATASILAFAAGSALAASAPNLPACAQICFLQAIGKTNCGLTDYYCQCTEGAKTIQEDATSCLCANMGSAQGCSAAEMLQVQKASNQICEAALSASSQTYTPITATNACKAESTGTKTTGSGSASASTTASTSGNTSTGTNTAAAAASSSAAPSSSAAGAAPTNMARIEGAVLGLAGLLAAAL